jgi:hypothetical protein
MGSGQFTHPFLFGVLIFAIVAFNIRPLPIWQVPK